MGRDAFLQRVREALGGGRRDPDADARPVGAAGLPRADRPAGDAAALAARFAREARAVGCDVARIAPAEVAARCAAHAREQGARSFVAWEPEGGLGAAAVAGLREAGLEGLEWRGLPAGEPRRRLASADLGLVVADLAIAASGTAVLVHGAGRPRAVSLLPRHLIVLVPEDRLRPTLAEALADLAPALRRPDGPQNVTFITGPSKSADIEGELVVGAHGPYRVLHLLVAPGGEHQ